MIMRVFRSRCRFLAVSMAVAVLLLSCGSDPVNLPTEAAPGAQRVVFVTSTPGPRPTLWPTFTPHPTPQLEMLVTATPQPGAAATFAAAPTATLPAPGAETAEPTVRAAAIRVASVPTAVPEGPGEDVATPEPGVGLGEPEPVDHIVVDGEVREVPQGQRVSLGGGAGFLTVRLHALFPYQYESPPRFLTHGDVGWPAGVDFISRGSRYVYWAIQFDDSDAVGDWSKGLFIRWVDDVIYRETGKVMIEAPTQVQPSATTIYLGVGRPQPGFWQPGRYTVSLLDGAFLEILSHSFEVR